MKFRDILKGTIVANEQAFSGITEARAMKILSLVLTNLGEELDGIDEGKVSIPGFGTFVVKQVERVKDGTTVQKKRIVLRRPKQD